MKYLQFSYDGVTKKQIGVSKEDETLEKFSRFQLSLDMCYAFIFIY